MQCDWERTGLSQQEAEKRLAEQGKNKLEEGRKPGAAARFFKQLADPMILVLIAAAVVSGITAAYAGESMADVFIILFVVIFNSILGVLQESKAEKAIEALKEMTSAVSKVLRDGQVISEKSENLVTGDIVLLEAGDAVPADCRVLESAALKVEEAALTGESVPVDKTAEETCSDRENLIFMGSTVVYGRGKAVVLSTGMDTEMGKIADAIAMAKEEKTPLQLKLAQLSKVLTWLVLGICVFLFAFGVWKAGDFHTEAILDTFLLAVSLAVAAIPEGLAAVVTIVLSIGVTRMSRKNAVIRKLTAVETLGSAQVICSDKTGTLTQNKMTVVEHYGENLQLLAEAMTLCNDAELGADGLAVGEPTECALVEDGLKQGLPKDRLKEEKPRVGEVPFDSNRKRMTTFHRIGTEYVQYTKGAPDELLKCCRQYIFDGKVVDLTEEKRQEILNANKAFADRALRVLGAAYRLWKELPKDFSAETAEQDLIFIGLAGMIDPVRPEVRNAIRICKTAGIRPIMITGDHKDTAVAIAKELGMISGPEEALTGEELNQISDAELEYAITRYSVYARVQPEHKVRIVKAWKAKGAVTAMTGDGVNDAPALKYADIGVGMGITGTDVTKNVADMVLADDNFATIVFAVDEGRRIYSNIRKAIQFLLASNLSEVTAIFTATLLGFTLLSPVHVLWINLITDTLPALALGMEAGEADRMQKPPRPAKEGLFAGGVGWAVCYQGILIAFLTLLAYGIGNRTSHVTGVTMAFFTMSMAELFHACNMRSQTQSLFSFRTHNLYLFGAMALALILSTLLIEVPILAELFGFAELSLYQYGASLGLAFCMIPVVELVKSAQRWYNVRRTKRKEPER